MKKLITFLIILFISLSVSGQAGEIEFISEGKKLNTYFYKGIGTENLFRPNGIIKQLATPSALAKKTKSAHKHHHLTKKSNTLQ